ncbi:hypothetical protein B0H14DRAFT_2904906 [Mycena olivaceomarginata]|nr:hypothetical protein B0H14DRAFT_2904906 [Mycena olivaceomarginata]
MSLFRRGSQPSGSPGLWLILAWTFNFSAQDHTDHSPAPPTGQSPSVISDTWPPYTAHTVRALGYLSRSLI